MIVRIVILVFAVAFLSACAAKKDSFIGRGLGKGAKDADQIAEPNAMAKGPGLLTGKKGGVEIYSEDDEDASSDPTKPRRVKRRRR
jgi:hypothetical protein